MPIFDAITDTLRYALGLGPHPATLVQQSALGQTTMSVQVPVSSPALSPTPNFNSHLDLVDVEFWKRKLEESKAKEENAMFSVSRPNSYIRVFAVLEQTLREGSRCSPN